jgi:hypothetical protein
LITTGVGNSARAGTARGTEAAVGISRQYPLHNLWYTAQLPLINCPKDTLKERKVPPIL